MNPTKHLTSVQHLQLLPIRLGELAARMSPSRQQAAQPKSPMSAVLEHLNQPRSASEHSMDKLKAHEFIMND